jgi:uncharacterized protein YqfB (UPF0267 family)
MQCNAMQRNAMQLNVCYTTQVQDFLSVKYAITLFCKAIELRNLSTITLQETLVTARNKFEKCMLANLKQQVRDIFAGMFLRSVFYFLYFIFMFVVVS